MFLKMGKVQDMHLDDIFIRRAEGKDAPKIVSVQRSCVLETNSKVYPSEIIKEWASEITLDNILAQLGNSSWVVASLRGKVVGVAQYSVKDKKIYQVDVSPKFQGQGIGEAIYRYIEDDFLKQGIKEVFLYSTLNAVGFWTQMGFKSVQETNFRLAKNSLQMVEMLRGLKSE